MGNRLIKSLAVAGAVYGIAKIGELVGVLKGIVTGCRISRDYPNEGTKIADDWDELETKWEALKSRYKA